MYRAIIITFILLLVFVNLLGTERVSGNLIIKHHQNVREANRDEFISRYSENHFKQERVLSKRLNIYLYSFDAHLIGEGEMLSLIKTDNDVELVQFNHIAHPRELIPNDTMFNEQWSLKNTGQSSGTVGADIKATFAWQHLHNEQNKNQREIVVAVIDDFFDLLHTDVNWWKNIHEIEDSEEDNCGNGFAGDYHGWNALTNNGNMNLPVSTSAHGTHVSGISSAIGNNSEGISGIGWDIKVMPIRAYAQTVLEENIVVAYDYVLENRILYNETNGEKGAFVVATNSSFGVGSYGANPENYPIWGAMYDAMGMAGILSAVACPNANVNVDNVNDVPSGFNSPYLISVTNMNRFDNKATNAGYGLNTIDIGAPGVDILSAVRTSLVSGNIRINNYAVRSGTSMATPHVAGVIGLMYKAASEPLLKQYEDNPNGLALLFKQYLLEGVDPLSALQGVTVSGGRLNSLNPVLSVIELNSTVPIFNPPKNLLAEFINNTVKLTWHLPDIRQLSSFSIYRNNILLEENITTAMFIDHNIENNTHYTYHVLAVYVNPDGVSEPSNAVEIVPLFPPRDISFTFDGINVVLYWQSPDFSFNIEVDSSKIDFGYNVYRNNSLLTADPITTLTWTDTNTVAGSSYLYGLTAVYPVGESSPISLHLTTPTFNPPMNLTATNEQTGILLEWDAPSVAVSNVPTKQSNDEINRFETLSGYRVFRNGEIITELIDSLTYLDSDVMSNTMYVYHVTAMYIEPYGESVPSNSVEIMIIDFKPPLNLVAQPNQNTIELTWDAPAFGQKQQKIESRSTSTRQMVSLIGYKVYRNMTPISNIINSLNYIDEHIENNLLYTYYVTALYQEPDGESVPSNMVEIMITEFNPPVLLDVSIGNGVVDLQWHLPIPSLHNDNNVFNKSISENHFNVLRSLYIDLYGFNIYRNGELLAENIFQTQFTDSTAANNTFYSYYVTALYANPHGESEASNIVDILTRYPVQNLSASHLGYNVLLEWESPHSTRLKKSSADGYRVYRNGVLLTTPPTTNLYYMDQNTTPGSLYIYEVCAVYGNDESPPQNTPVIIPLFNPPVDFVAIVLENSNNVELVWKEPVEMLEFEVLLGYKISRGDSLLTKEPIKDTVFRDDDLPNGSYTYKLVAVYELGASIAIEETVHIKVSDADNIKLDLKTLLKGNYPNPFNPETIINYSMAKDGNVEINIFNVRGQKVKTLLNSHIREGEHQILWDATDDNYQRVGSGIYFCVMKTHEYSAIKRMLLLK